MSAETGDIWADCEFIDHVAMAIINLREGSLQDYRPETPDDIEAERRLFYVALTRAERFLLYVAEHDRWGNPPSRFLGEAGVAFD